MYKTNITAIITVLLIILTSLISCGQPEAHTIDFFAMDTFMTLKIYTDRDDLADKVKSEIKRLEALFSATREGSDINRLNSDGYAEVSDDTARLVAQALGYCGLTDGALDISIYPLVRLWGFTTGEYRVPGENEITDELRLVDYTQIKVDGNKITLGEGMSIDLGAVAKGYTGDRLCELLRESGVTSAVLNLGGNAQTIGSKPDGSDWRVGVRNPFSPDENMLIIGVSDCAVITSGNYERYFVGDDGRHYCHIIDPKTGRPSESGIVSMSIIGKNGLKCDALSTALYILGEESAVELWRESDDFEMIFVTADKRLKVTEGVDVVSNLSGLEIEVITRE